jgi:hypothetical protein
VTEYAKDYNAGWRAYVSGGSGIEKPHPKAWHDGYMDAAMGLPKWHRRDCPETMGHDNCRDPA